MIAIWPFAHDPQEDIDLAMRTIPVSDQEGAVTAEMWKLDHVAALPLLAKKAVGAG